MIGGDRFFGEFFALERGAARLQSLLYWFRYSLGKIISKMFGEAPNPAREARALSGGRVFTHN